MESKDIFIAMWDYLDTRNSLSYDKAPKNWRDADEWIEALGINISAKKIATMYREGLVDRYRNKSWYKDTKWHYFPKPRLAVNLIE